jgi:hypothetical protein
MKYNETRMMPLDQWLREAFQWVSAHPDADSPSAENKSFDRWEKYAEFFEEHPAVYVPVNRDGLTISEPDLAHMMDVVRMEHEISKVAGPEFARQFCLDLEDACACIAMRQM